MVRIYSTKQALALRGQVPDLALLRSIQFQGSGYEPEVHGHIVVVQSDGDAHGITEIGPDGLVLFDEDGMPTYEYVEAFLETSGIVYELVFQVDDSRTVAVIVTDGSWLAPRLREELRQAAGSTEPAPVPPID